MKKVARKEKLHDPAFLRAGCHKVIFGIYPWPHLYFFGALLYISNDKYYHMQILRWWQSKRQSRPRRRLKRRRSKSSSRQGSLRRIKVRKRWMRLQWKRSRRRTQRLGSRSTHSTWVNILLKRNRIQYTVVTSDLTLANQITIITQPHINICVAA